MNKKGPEFEKHERPPATDIPIGLTDDELRIIQKITDQFRSFSPPITRDTESYIDKNEPRFYVAPNLYNHNSKRKPFKSGWLGRLMDDLTGINGYPKTKL